MMVLSSCVSTDEPILMHQHTAHDATACKTRSSNDNVLSFKDCNEFNDALEILTDLPSDEERMQWVSNRYPDFKSIQMLYWEAMDEMGKMEDVGIEEYETFQEKYSTLYFPKFMEDAGYYIPMTNLTAAFLCNQDCEVIIGEQLLSFKDIDDYGTLMDLGRAYYSNYECI